METFPLFVLASKVRPVPPPGTLSVDGRQLNEEVRTPVLLSRNKSLFSTDTHHHVGFISE